MPTGIKLLFNKIWPGAKFFYQALARAIDALAAEPGKTLALVVIFYFVDYFWRLASAISVVLLLGVYFFFGWERISAIAKHILAVLPPIRIDFYKIYSQIKSLYNFLTKPIDDLAEHPFRTLFLFGIFYFIDYFWQFQAAFFATLFLLCALFRWSSKIFFGFGLMFIFISPILLLKLKIAEVDVYAVYGYNFLFLGATLQIIYYLQDRFKRSS